MTGRRTNMAIPSAASPAPDSSRPVEYTVSSAVAEVAAVGAAHVFGVMGEGNAFFLDAAERSGLPVTPVRHESGAISAADAFYRASGQIAVATTTYGAGFSNAMTALIEATKARIPMLYVTGGSGENAKPWDIDELAILATLGVPAFVVTPDNAAQLTREALVVASSRSRPAAIVIPEHLASAPATPASIEELGPLKPRLTSVSPTLVDDVAQLLLKARRPLILGGRGVWVARAADAYMEVAGVLGADLATTAAARSLFGAGIPVIGWEDNAVDGNPGLFGGEVPAPAPTSTAASDVLGIAGGFADSTTAAEIKDADVVLAVGTSLTPFTMRFGEGFARDATLVQVTTDSTHFHPRADVTLEADAAEFGQVLLERIRAEWNSGRADPQRETPQFSDVGVGAFPRPASEPTLPEAPGKRGDPQQIAIAIGKILPREITVVSDGGHFIGWPAMYWEVPDPSAFMQLGTAYKCIGLGTGGAVGAATARPDRTTVLVTGDGGLQMSLADLVTFAGVPGRKIVVVFNDAGYGAELHQFGWRNLSLTMAELGDRNFAALGRAFGGEGVTIESLADTGQLVQWIESHEEAEDSFLVVDCKVTRKIAPFFQEIVDRAKPPVDH